MLVRDAQCYALANSETLLNFGASLMADVDQPNVFTRRRVRLAALRGAFLGLILIGLSLAVVSVVAHDSLNAENEQGHDRSLPQLIRDAADWKLAIAVGIGVGAGSICLLGLHGPQNQQAARLSAIGWPFVTGIGWLLFRMTILLCQEGHVGWWAVVVIGGVVGACLGPLAWVLMHVLNIAGPPTISKDK